MPEYDVPQGFVQDAIRDITDPARYLDPLRISPERSERWTKALAARAGGPDQLAYTPFDGRAPSTLTPVETVFEHAIGSDEGVAGVLKAIGGAIGTGVNQPAVALTDRYQVGRIRDLQTAFLRDHGHTLDDLSRQLALAKRNIRELGEMLGKTTFDTGALRNLLDAKAHAGDDAYYNIEEALRRTTDPAERARLQAAKDDLDRWRSERDARLRQEQPEIDALRDLIDRLSTEFRRQQGVLERAAASDGPRTVTGTRDGRQEVLSTTHDQPGAVRHVASLHALLFDARARLTQAIAGRR